MRTATRSGPKFLVEYTVCRVRCVALVSDVYGVDLSSVAVLIGKRRSVADVCSDLMPLGQSNICSQAGGRSVLDGAYPTCSRNFPPRGLLHLPVVGAASCHDRTRRIPMTKQQHSVAETRKVYGSPLGHCVLPAVGTYVPGHAICHER